MTDEAALAEVKRLTNAGHVNFSTHARERMAERGAKRVDVFAALLSATSARRQTDHCTWRINGGVDMEDDNLTVCAVIESNLVIITVV